MPTPTPAGTRSGAPSPRWQAPSVEELRSKLLQYEVLEILGRGGMGAVYKARQKSLKRLVAIKILPLGMADDEFDFVERFQNEAQTMAQMNHPAIVNVYDFGETSDGLLYFVMEFVDGTDVHKMIQSSGRLNGEHALKITAHVCDALAYAHKRGVIHRDIKPANILIDSEGHIKVADFGLAKMHDPAQTSGLTRTNMAMGTPDYVAPEVLVTDIVADHRADLYAVGVMLYQMLTGEVPRGMFKLPSQKGIGTDPRFDEIICKAMEQDRDERYQSAMDLRHALDQIATAALPTNDELRLTSSASTQSAGAVEVQVIRPGEPTDLDLAHRPSPPKLHTFWLGVVAATSLVVVSGLMLFPGRQNGDDGKAPAARDAAEDQIDQAFLTQVAGEAPERQIELVRKKIKALNDSPVRLTPTVANGKIVAMQVHPDGQPGRWVHLWPLAAFRDLENLQIYTVGTGDIAWLRGMKINLLSIPNGTFSDLSVLRDLPVVFLELQNGPLRDYSVLKGKPMKRLRLSNSPVADFSFMTGMPLDDLRLDKTGITDLSPLRQMPLKELWCEIVPDRDAEILRAIPTLQKINEMPAAEFFASLESTVEASGETIDWINGLPPEASPWTAEWGGLKDGVLTPTSKCGRLFGIMKDGFVRVRIRLAPDYPMTDAYGPMLQLDIRHGSVKDATDTKGQFQFQVYVPNRDCKLLYQQRVGKGPNSSPLNLWEGSPRKLSETGNVEVDWEFRAIGDEFSAWADGKLIHTARLDKVTSGYCTLSLLPGMQITRLETVGLISTKTGSATDQADVGQETSGANASLNSTHPLPVISNWQDATSHAQEKARSIPDLIVDTQGLSLKPTGQAVIMPLDRDPEKGIAVRLTHTGDGQVSWRTPQGGVVYLLCQRTKTIFQTHPKDASTPTPLQSAVPHPDGFVHSDPHVIVMTQEGDRLAAWLDGRFIGEAQDEAFKESRPELYITKWGDVRKVEIGDTSPTGDVGSALSFPPVAWQDVTSTLHASLATKQGFIVDAAGVHRGPDAPVADTMVMGPSDKDRAVRVRYTNQTQVSLWFKGGAGSAYVLATDESTMFKKQSQKVGEAVSMVPSIVHPSGFDPTQSHELIVAVQDGAVWVWLDGRYLAQAKDSALRECSIAIVPMKNSTVQEVEMAELAERLTPPADHAPSTALPAPANAALP